MKKSLRCILPMLCIFHYAYPQQWNSEKLPGLISITSLTFDGPKIFATGITGNTTGGVFRKTSPTATTWDSGNTNYALSVNDVPYSFAVHPYGNTASLFVGTCSTSSTNSPPPSIQKSTDVALSTQSLNWGTNLTPSPTAYPCIFKALVINNNVLYAGTYGVKLGVFTSMNNGQNWTQATNNVCNDINTFLSFGNDVYAGTDLGIIKRTNNAGSWKLAGLQGVRVLSIAITADGNDIFAGTDGSGVYHGTHSGSAWTFSPFFSGLPSGATVNALLVDGTTVYAGISAPLGGSGPVLFSITKGSSGFVANLQNHWLPFNAGLNQIKKVTCLAKSGNYFYAGTNAGVFRYY